MKEYNLICVSTVAPWIISLPNVFQTTWHWAGCETWPGNVHTNNKNRPKNDELGSEWIQMKFKKRELSVNHWPVWFFFSSGRVKIKPVPQSRFITISIHLYINSMRFLRSKLSQFHRKWHFLCFLSSGCVQLLPSEVHQRFRLSEMVRCGDRGKNPLRETTAHHAQQNMGESFQPSQTLNFNSLLLSLLILQTLISFLHNFISNTFRKKH